MAEEEESKKGEMTAIPLITPHRMGNFNLSHR
jgi:mannose-6-phosphate isomerase-like protein (cupin superfamily)